MGKCESQERKEGREAGKEEGRDKGKRDAEWTSDKREEESCMQQKFTCDEGTKEAEHFRESEERESE